MGGVGWHKMAIREPKPWMECPHRGEVSQDRPNNHVSSQTCFTDRISASKPVCSKKNWGHKPSQNNTCRKKGYIFQIIQKVFPSKHKWLKWKCNCKLRPERNIVYCLGRNIDSKFHLHPHPTPAPPLYPIMSMSYLPLVTTRLIHAAIIFSSPWPPSQYFVKAGAKRRWAGPACDEYHVVSLEPPLVWTNTCSERVREVCLNSFGKHCFMEWCK